MYAAKDFSSWPLVFATAVLLGLSRQTVWQSRSLPPKEPALVLDLDLKFGKARDQSPRGRGDRSVCTL